MAPLCLRIPRNLACSLKRHTRGRISVPAVLAGSKVISKNHAIEEGGDLREALRTGAIIPDRVYAELGEIVTGKKRGRTSETEITLFKSVGIAIEDIATAVYVLEQAELKESGTPMTFGDDATGFENVRVK